METTARIVWLGHATVGIEVDGARFLTDPVLRGRLLHLRRRELAPEHDLRLDAVLLSHLHHDHLDLPSLLSLGRETTIVLPARAGRLLRRRGFTELVELDVGDEAQVGGATVRATYAEHPGWRIPGLGNSPALGYVVAGTRRVYFAGDTDLFDGLATIDPALDLARLPVAGWGRKVGRGHLDPARAAEAAALLRPRLAVPIHWGTLRPVRPLPGPPDPDPAAEFARLAAVRAPEVEVRILQPGERLDLP